MKPPACPSCAPRKREVSRRWGFVALAALTLTAPAFASNCLVVDKIDAFSKTNVAPQTATCATYLTKSAKTGTSCHWVFDFRDAKAREFADTLSDVLVICRDAAAPQADQKVNHPDSYDLRSWRTSTGVYSVSLKDKGARNETLVFLRLEPN